MKHSEQEILAKDYLPRLAQSSLRGNGPQLEVLTTIISATQGTSVQNPQLLLKVTCNLTGNQSLLANRYI